MLKIENIYKTFAKNKPDEKNIFNGFSFSADAGEFITIIGGNGAGKSTLMNIISGSTFPDSGKIYVDNLDVTYLPEHKRARLIGRVFQDPLKGTAPNLTVEENLSMAMLKKSSKNLKFAINKKISESLKEELLCLNLGLEDRLKSRVGLLSGGQRQALTLLMATIAEPKVLLLDEPTSALDPKSQDNILELIKKISNNSKMITLMITHNMEHAKQLGSRTMMIESGKIKMDVSGEKKKKYNQLKANNLEAVAGGALPYTKDNVIAMRDEALRLRDLAMKETDYNTKDLLLKRATQLSAEAKEMSDNLLREAREEQLKSQGWEIL